MPGPNINVPLARGHDESTIKRAIINSTDSLLKKFASAITEDENAGLREQLVKATDPNIFKEKLSEVVGAIEGLTDDQKQSFNDDLIQEYETYFNEFSLQMSNDTDRKFKELTQQLVSGLETQGHGKETEIISGDLAQSIGKVSRGETTEKEIDITNVNDNTVSMSTDYIKQDTNNNSLVTNLENQYEIKGGELKSKGNRKEFIKNFKDLNAEIIDLKYKLRLDLERQTRALDRIDQETDADAYTAQEEELREINNSINYLNKVQEDQLAEAKKGPGKMHSGTVETLETEVKKNDDLEKSMSNAVNGFEIINQGARGFSDEMQKVTQVAGGLSEAFGTLSDDMSGMKSVKSSFDGLTSAFSQGIISLGAFVALMGIVGNAVTDFHSQLDISRGMGDNSGGMVKALQKMHIKTLMDPGQLKDLSDKISTNFNVSLSRNAVEMEKVSIKQRLSERVMGKEYASDQMEALNSLKTVLEGSSPSAMMDSLAAETSALAKTMGVSNKYALEQIKALYENSKMIGKGLAKDQVKEIKEALAGIDAADKAAGYSEEYRKENQEFIKQFATDADFMTDQMFASANIQKMSAEAAQFAQAEEAKLAKDMHGMSKEQFLAKAKVDLAFAKKNATTIAKLGDISKKTQEIGMVEMDRKSKDKSLSKEERAEWDSKYNFALRKGYQDSGETKDKMKEQDSVEAYMKTRNDAKETQAKRTKGENATQDLNAVLLSMGATDNKSRLEAMDKLVKAIPKNKTDEFNKTMAEFNKTMAEFAGVDLATIENDRKKMDPEQFAEKYAQAQTDAYKTVMADYIKNIASGKENKLGVNLSPEAVKSMKNSKDFTEKSANLSATKVEKTKDQAERAAVIAQYKIQNVVMDGVNGALDLLNKAITLLTDNLGIVAAVLGGAFLTKLLASETGLKAISLFGTGLKGAASVVGGFGESMTKGIIGAHKALFKVSGVITSKLKAFGASIKDKGLWTTLKDGAKGAWATVRDGAKNMWNGVVGKLQGIGGGATITKDKDGKVKKKGLFSSMGAGIKGLMVPAALAGAAMKGLQGAMEGWGKAADWFGSSLDGIGDKLKKNTPASEALAKSINKNAVWNKELGYWTDEYGKKIQSQGDILKQGMVILDESSEEYKNMSKAEKEAYQEKKAAGLEAQKLAESLSKTGTALWDGSKYVDEFGRTIEAQPSIMQKSASAVGGALEALSFGLLDGQKMAHKVAKAFEWIGDFIMEKLSIIPGIDSPEEAKTKEKAKKGDDIHKQLVAQGLITDDYGNDDVSAEQAAKMTAEQIGAILAAHNNSMTGTLEGGAIDELKKALQSKADAGDESAKLELKTLPAKKEGGSTGGTVGDAIQGAFEEMQVFAASPIEKAVATAGENEYVANEEDGDILTNVFNKVKSYVSNVTGIGKDKSGKASVSPDIGKLPSASGSDIKATEKMKDVQTKDAQKAQFKEQKKIADETVKKTTKDGIDDKQATQMVTSLKDVVVNLKEQGKSLAGGGMLTGDMSLSEGVDALKNVGKNLLGENLTGALKGVTDKLGKTGSSIVNNMQGVLTGETSIGTALSNVGETMKGQLLGPLQTSLSNGLTSLTGPEGIGGLFEGGSGGGVVDSVVSVGKSLFGGFFDGGGVAPKEKISVVHQGEALIQPSGNTMVLTPQDVITAAAQMGIPLAKGSGFDMQGGDKASASNIPSSGGTSGLSSMKDVKSSTTINNAGNRTVASDNSSTTTNNTTNVTESGGTLDQAALLKSIDANTKMMASHLGQRVKQGDREFKANVNGQTVQNVKNMKGSRTIH